MNFVPFIIPGVIALVVIILLASGYLKAPPDVAYVISGLRKKPRVLVGQAGIKVPFFERVDKLALGAIQIDVKTKTAVPTAEYINVRVDSTVSVRVGRSDEMIALAAQNFLNVNRDTIASKISDKVQANVVPDLARFGLELVSFNVQNFVDDNSVIDNLGIDNVEQIRKKAAIAKSDAQREIAIAEAENAKQSNDAKVKAAEEIAKRNNDLAIKEAELKKEADTKRAEAEAAKTIEAENQRKQQEIATANANLARQEKEIELKEREVAIKEKALEAEIKKTAEAQKFAEQQKADAKLYATQKAAEADLYDRERKAEAAKVEAEKKAAADLALATAEAEAQKKLAEAIEAEGKAKAAAAQALGLAEAEAIRAKAEAEAKGMLEKAEAMKQFQDAAMADMQLQAIKAYFEQLPEIAKAIGEGYNGVDKIVMLGGDSTQLAGNIMNTTTQISEGIAQSLGIDLKTIMSSFFGNIAAEKVLDNNG